MTPIQLPKLGMQTTEAEISDWLVHIGSNVNMGENVCEIATDKVEVTIPSTCVGVVAELCYEVGDTVRVGDTLCLIATLPDEVEQVGRDRSLNRE